MAFDWREYLVLARELAGRREEAALRSAISRAYYAALGRARTQLEQEGLTLSLGDNLHAQVWDAYRVSSEDARYYIGVDGRALRSNRNTADYEAEIDELPLRARRAIRQAEQIINALERLQP